MTRIRIIFGIGMVVLAALQASGARAWEVYDHSSPYDTETVDHNPGRMQIYFTDPVAFRSVTMTDTAGRNVPVKFGKPEDDTTSIEIWLPADLGPDTYTLTWNAYVTSHGHADSGEIHFTIRAQ